jgi:hypothetical protein
MALVIGTSCGFVTVAPVDDPVGTNALIDTRMHAGRFTSPEGSNAISSMGWWCDTATEAANYQLGIYSHDAVNDRPNARLGVTGDIAKGLDAGWKTSALAYNLVASTTYWLAVQLDNTATSTQDNNTATVGEKLDFSISNSLLDPWGVSGGSSAALLGVYAVYAAAAGGVIGTRFLSNNIFPTVQLFKGGNL